MPTVDLQQLLVSLRQHNFMYFFYIFLVLMHQIHYIQGVQVRCCLCPSNVSFGVHVRLLTAYAATALWNVCANPAVLARSDPNTTPTSPPPFTAVFVSLRLRLPSSSPKELRLGSPPSPVLTYSIRYVLKELNAYHRCGRLTYLISLGNHRDASYLILRPRFSKPEAAQFHVCFYIFS